MFASEDFAKYNIGIDPYKGVEARVKLDDLEPRDDSLPIKLSMMISTYHRYSQLQRSLECLARQDWKEFEVLICDDGDEYDLSPIFEMFSPYLRLKTIRRERKQFHVDPTGGFRALMPLAEGEIWAIMQPEMMLFPDAIRLLYEGNYRDLPGANNYFLSKNPVENPERWVALKAEWMAPQTQNVMDNYDWHSSLENLKLIPYYMTIGYGLSNCSNAFWKDAIEFPWWFVGATKRESGIWSDMPEYLGHASIDFYTIGYREKHNFMDVVPFKPLCIHQDHHRIAIGVAGEPEQIAKDIQESLK